MTFSSKRKRDSCLNFLILAYKYPPFPGVGARRIASIVKELVRSGNNVDLITVDWSGELSPVDDDGNPSVHVVPSRFPHKFVHSIADTKPPFIKTLKKIFANILAVTFFWDDEAQRWGGSVIPTANDIIQSRKIDVVLATGHPFQSNYIATKIKKYNPGIFLVQDFRDPWVGSLYVNWIPSRKKKLYHMQKEACAKADLICTVTDHLAVFYRQLLPSGGPEKIVKIPNGYDAAIIAEAKRNAKKNARKKYKSGVGIRLIHIGNITNGRDVSFLLFLESLKKMEKKVKAQIEVILAGYIPDAILKGLRKSYAGLPVRYLGRLNYLRALTLAAQSDFVLHFGSENFPDAVSTKVYEYAALSKPVISFNFGGELENLILDRSLGYSINVCKKKSLKDSLEIILSEQPDFKYNVGDLSYENLTAHYLDCIKRRVKIVNDKNKHSECGRGHDNPNSS